MRKTEIRKTMRDRDGGRETERYGGGSFSHRKYQVCTLLLYRGYPVTFSVSLSDRLLIPSQVPLDPFRIPSH